MSSRLVILLWNIVVEHAPANVWKFWLLYHIQCCSWISSKHASSRKERLMASASETTTQIFYVPPHKLRQFLEESSPIFGDSRWTIYLPIFHELQLVYYQMVRVRGNFWRSYSFLMRGFSMTRWAVWFILWLSGREIHLSQKYLLFYFFYGRYSFLDVYASVYLHSSKTYRQSTEGKEHIMDSLSM